MAKAILGTKIGMMQIWDDAGQMIPVTAVEAGPCAVLQKKTVEKEGYNSIQVGYSELKPKHITKPMAGHQKKAHEKLKSYYKHLSEIRDCSLELEVGDTYDCSIFNSGDKVFLSSLGKGKGFQGVVKRYGFHGGRGSHGSTFHRAPGSIGAGTYPGEVIKGKRMPGRMGGKKVTVRNVEIARIIKEKNIILVKGPVPGAVGAIVNIYQA